MSDNSTEMADAEKRDVELGPSPGVDSVESSIQGEEHQQPEKVETANIALLDWDSPDDSDNPKNWKSGRKTYHLICVGLYAFTCTFMSSVYAPGANQAAAALGVSETVSILGISLFCVGLSLGPMIGSPLSEEFGRLMVYRFSLPIASLFIIGSGAANTAAGVLICRFFAGAFASPALGIGGASVADMFSPSQYGQATSGFLLAPFFGPSLSPVIGGFVVEHKGWRWLEWVSLMLSAITIVATMGMRETHKGIILERRAKKRGLKVADDCQISTAHALRSMLRDAMLRPLVMLGTEPIVSFLSLYIGFNFAVLYGFFASLQLVFFEVYDFKPHETGLTFLSLAIGATLATITCLVMDKLIYQKKHQQLTKQGIKKVPPEYRLYPAMVGSIGVVVSLFWFAWTARRGISWASPVVALIPFNWGNLCIFTSAAIFLMDCYGPRYGASSIAANGFVRYMFAMAFPLFIIPMYNNLTPKWATSLLGFISLALTPTPWILFVWGPKLRSWSRLATSLE